jgi:hypothetical protein
VLHEASLFIVALTGMVAAFAGAIKAYASVIEARAKLERVRGKINTSMRYTEIISTIPKKRVRRTKLDTGALKAVGVDPKDVPPQAVSEDKLTEAGST